MMEIHALTVREYAKRDEALTRAELGIAKLIAEAKSNQAIADELFIDIRTVENHVNNIYSKLAVNKEKAPGVHPRVMVTLMYLKMGE